MNERGGDGGSGGGLRCDGYRGGRERDGVRNLGEEIIDWEKKSRVEDEIEIFSRGSRNDGLCSGQRKTY